MTTVTTSIVIEFDAEDGVEYIFNAEVDAREDGLNNGNTSFRPGDPVYFLLYRTDNTVVDGIIVTHGTVNLHGPETTRDLEEDFATFISDDSVGLTYPVHSNFTGEWIGDNSDLGTVVVQNQSVIALSQVPLEADGITPQEHYAGVYRYSYTTDFQPYRLYHVAIPDETNYQIVIYIYGHSI